MKSAILAASGTPPLKNPVTLAQSSDGVLWQELFTAPGQLAAIYEGILNNGRAISENVDNVEFIALSDLLQGVDQPRTWDGQYLDRVSQVGPGAGPFPASGGAGEVLIVSISQPGTHSIFAIGTNGGGVGNVYATTPTLPQSEFAVGALFTIAGVTYAGFDTANAVVLYDVADVSYGRDGLAFTPVPLIKHHQFGWNDSKPACHL